MTDGPGPLKKNKKKKKKGKRKALAPYFNAEMMQQYDNLGAR